MCLTCLPISGPDRCREHERRTAACGPVCRKAAGLLTTTCRRSGDRLSAPEAHMNEGQLSSADGESLNG